MGCWYCGGTGEFVACPDDLCHGQERCIHGDPPIVCPECKGKGDDFDEDYDDDFEGEDDRDAEAEAAEDAAREGLLQRQPERMRGA